MSEPRHAMVRPECAGPYFRGRVGEVVLEHLGIVRLNYGGCNEFLFSSEQVVSVVGCRDQHDAGDEDRK